MERVVYEVVIPIAGGQELSLCASNEPQVISAVVAAITACQQGGVDCIVVRRKTTWDKLAQS